MDATGDGVGPEGVRATREWRGPAGLRLDLVLVPPGPFVMGRDDGERAERPRHRHVVATTFWIARRPVTQAQYRAFAEAAGAEFPAQGWLRARGDAPMTCVTWSEARAFCAWAGLALPTEAEWEKAARGVDGRLFPWGDDLRDQAPHGAAPVAPPLAAFVVPGVSASRGVEHAASPYGVLDLVDGIGEWCEEPFHERVYEWYARGDFAPPGSGVDRVVRGGAWPGRYEAVPLTTRRRAPPDRRDAQVGFRPVLRERGG